MPRNAAGNYTLPNPDVVPNTTILSTDENVTRDDLAAEMTNSLDRNGRGPMLSPVKVPDGLIALPAYAWTNESNSGWYRKGTNDFWYSVGGVDVFNINASGIAMASGKFIAGIVIQDAEPTSPPKGTVWFESDTGVSYMRYQNPDLTYAWIQMNPLVV